MDGLSEELHNAREREAATREILRVISRSRADYEPVFDAILKNATRLCEAPLGILFLRRDDRLVAVATLGARSEWVDFITKNPLRLDATQSGTARAVVEGVTLQTKDTADDQLYRDREPHRVASVDIEGIRTRLAVPMLNEDEGVGAIVLYRREVRLFEEKHLNLVSTFADQAVIAIENVRLFRELESQAGELASWNRELEKRVTAQVDELERLGRLRRFLSPQVADAVVSTGEESLLGSHRALIATVFCDLRGFTAFCESAEPEEAIEVLQTYHQAMGMLIHEHGGTIDHRAGDGIMVIFNDPLPCEDAAGTALAMAVRMRDRMAALSAEWRKIGHRLGFGVGISLGYATVGMVGFEGRYDYTANGSTVNLAARLCDEAGNGEILLSSRAYSAVEDRIEAAPSEELMLKGFHAPLEVFRVTGPLEDSPESGLKKTSE